MTVASKKGWKGFFCLIAVLLLNLASVLSVSAAQASSQGQLSSGGQPSIDISHFSYDFGEAMEGAEVEHDFQVRNTGIGFLNIDRVKTS